MTSFLDAVDAMLREGARSLGEPFRQRGRDYVTQRQQPSGAFPNPAGTPDLYYTDFGTRLLWLLEAPAESLAAAAGWSAQQNAASIVACFNALNIRRLSGTAGLPLPPLPQTGPAEAAYDLFLLSLLHEMRGESQVVPVSQLLNLRRDDGGFAQSRSSDASQTNATAAVLSLLWREELEPHIIPQACDYLAARQTASGGFAAHTSAPADLLSTFSALLSLTTLGRLPELPVDLAAAARFVRSCARSDGGFAASGDAGVVSDIEYTYYGVGSAALLRYIADNP